MCPITLLEYGEWALGRGTMMCVGVADDYDKRNDVYVQTKLARPDINVVDNLEALMFELIDLVDKYHKTKIKDLIT